MTRRIRAGSLACAWLRLLFIAALVATGMGIAVERSSAAGNFVNGAVASAAEAYANGSLGGQCKQFANNAVKGASGNTINLTGYQQGYANAGGVEVSSSDAVRGDIIQVTPNGSIDSNVEWYYDQGRTALHTAIILANNGGGNFSVIDSNWGNNSLVQRHSFNPYSWAASKPYGGIVKIWRLGTVTASLPASDGIHHVFMGTQAGSIYEMYWGNGLPRTIYKMGSADGVVNSIDYVQTSDGVSHVFTGTQTGSIYETYFGGGQPVTTYRMDGADSAISDLEYTRTSDGIHHVFMGTQAGSIYEMYWGNGLPRTIYKMGSADGVVNGLEYVIT